MRILGKIAHYDKVPVYSENFNLIIEYHHLDDD